MEAPNVDEARPLLADAFDQFDRHVSSSSSALPPLESPPYSGYEEQLVPADRPDHSNLEDDVLPEESVLGRRIDW